MSATILSPPTVSLLQLCRRTVTFAYIGAARHFGARWLQGPVGSFVLSCREMVTSVFTAAPQRITLAMLCGAQWRPHPAASLTPLCRTTVTFAYIAAAQPARHFGARWQRIQSRISRSRVSRTTLPTLPFYTPALTSCTDKRFVIRRHSRRAAQSAVLNRSPRHLVGPIHSL